MRELRIALLTHSLNPRGGVVHTLELARALQGLGHDVTVFAPAEPGQRLFREVPHRVERVPVGPKPANVTEMVGERIEAFTRHLAACLRRERYDVFHTHDGIGGNALATLYEAGAIPGFVRTVHHLDRFTEPQLAAWQDRAVTQASQVLCVSPSWCDKLRREHGIEASFVPNGVDLHRFTCAPNAQDGALARRLRLDLTAPVLLSVGGVEARKNSLRILQAWLALRQTHPRTQLVIAGGASLLDHRGYAAAFHQAAEGVGSGLVLTGTLNDDEMPSLFRLADALVMPSLVEGFGLVVLEALACGTPVVVSNIAPFTEYLQDTATAGHALWCDPLDVASITHAMRGAIEPARAARLSAGPPPVCQRFHWPASAARHVALYRAGMALWPAHPIPPLVDA